MQEITTTGPTGPQERNRQRGSRRDFRPTNRTAKAFDLLGQARAEQDPDRRAALLAETERAVQDLEVRQALAAARYSTKGLGHAIVILEQELGRKSPHLELAKSRLTEEMTFALQSLDQLYEAMSQLRQLRPDACHDQWLGFVEVARNAMRMAARKLGPAAPS